MKRKFNFSRHESDTEIGSETETGEDGPDTTSAGPSAAGLSAAVPSTAGPGSSTTGPGPSTLARQKLKKLISILQRL